MSGKKNWHGLLEIIEIKHIRDGKILWEDGGIKNTLHTSGEEFILKALFSEDVDIPSSYYFGLDNRSTIAVADVMSDITNEPTSNGYARQTLNSTDDFTFEIIGGVNRARSSALTFTASGGDWGPIKNLFMSNISQSEDDSSGYLISSASIGTSRIVEAGDAISMRMAISLKNCP